MQSAKGNVEGNRIVSTAACVRARPRRGRLGTYFSFGAYSYDRPHPLPSCSAGHLGRSRIFAGYALLFCADGNGPEPIQPRQPKQETTMNWDRLEGNWKQLKGRVQQKWGKLTNDDLNLVEGKRTELVGRIQERYGLQRDEAERQIDSWLRNMT
jgi:uncharacterized protein YjbJ (UPF0337 family)